MMTNNPLLGWEYQPAEIEASKCEMEAQGLVVGFSDAQPALKGYGAGKNRYLFEAEAKLFGKDRGAFSQARGTCVSQSTGRAIQDTLYTAIVDGRVLSEPVSIAIEVIYAGSRIQIGRGRLGNGDGAIGAQAAQFNHDYGLLARGVYGRYDLSKPNENYSVSWGKPGVGVPQELIQECRKHIGINTHSVDDMDDLRDAIAAGYAGCFCCGSLWQHPYSSSANKRDSKGFCRIIDKGGHAEAIVGVFNSGSLSFIRRNSWGSMPGGPDTITDSDGRQVKLPEGAYAVDADEMAKAMRAGGECWVYQIEESATWQPESLSAGDFLSQKGTV